MRKRMSNHRYAFNYIDARYMPNKNWPRDLGFYYKQLNLQNKLSETCTKLTFPLIMERIWCYLKTYLLNIWCIGNKLFTSFLGAIAQLGEHLLCKQEVVGSIPTSSIETSKNVNKTLNISTIYWSLLYNTFRWTLKVMFAFFCSNENLDIMYMHF